MLIDCSRCQSRVDGKVLSENSSWDPENEPGPTKEVFLKCPVCGSSLLGYAQNYQVGRDEWEWSALKRIWPEPESYLHYSIPDEVRSSLLEARTCYNAGASRACAVMCGRALEAMCVAHTSEKTLHKGLQALRDSGVIDGRLFDWGDSLRKERNIGAHATEQNVSMEDAKDVLEFATAICEYVYVLSDRYESYKKRKAADSKPS